MPSRFKPTAKSLLAEPDGKILVGGTFNTLAGQGRTNIGRLNVDGSLDNSFDPGADAPVRSLALQSDGRILVGGMFSALGGQSRTNIGRLNSDGSLDAGFNPGADDFVYCLAVQPDGRILAGGHFSTLGGQACPKLGRLMADGGLDTSFNPGADDSVFSLALQTDGKILAGGQFGVLGGTNRSCIGRLNTDGSLDVTFDPGVTGGTPASVFALALQNDGKILLGGQFTTLAGQSNTNLGRLSADGTLDSALTPDADDAVYSVAIEASGRILVGGFFNRLAGQSHRRIGRLNPEGALDTSFNPGVASPGQPTNRVFSLAVQSDGKILVGGEFTRLDGNIRNNIGRLNANGSLDTALVSGASGNQGLNAVYGLAVQPDGKILVGGTFNTLAGQGRTNIGRLNVDGTLDASFIATRLVDVISLVVQGDGKILVGTMGEIRRLNSDGSRDLAFQPAASGNIDVMAVQADGKIVVGGEILLSGHQLLSNIGRLNPDGSLDKTFDPEADYPVRTLAVQPDGKILVGGRFTMLAGQPRNSIGRLNPDGSLDNAFNPAADNVVYALAIQPNGKIIVGGNFTTLGPDGAKRSRIGRLNRDGTLDDSFNPGADQLICNLALQADGKIVVGGFLSILDGQTRNRIGRLNPDGTLDPTFDPEANNTVYSVAVQADGAVLAGGSFTMLGGQTHNLIGRASTANAALQRLAIDATGTILTWSRTGSAPEIDQVWFEQSNDRTNYTLLGAALRIKGGWQLTGLSLPTGQNFYVRARGHTSGGEYNGSSGLVESVAQFYRVPPPQFTALTILGDGAFQFAFTSSALDRFTILASTNLGSASSNWLSLG